MKCHEARELLIHYSNGEIGRSERELLQAHLAQCESCYRHLQSLSSVEQHIRTGLHEAADAAEPSPMAWQDLSHKLASRRNGHPTSHLPLPLVWRLMGGLSATIAFAVLVGAIIVSPQFGFNQKPSAVAKNAAASNISTTHITANAPIEPRASTGQADSAVGAPAIMAPPQKQARALFKSEPDSFLSKVQVHDEPELEFISQLNCSYCLKMR